MPRNSFARSRNLRTYLEPLESRLLLTGANCPPNVTQVGSTVTIVGQPIDDVVELQMGTNFHTVDFSGFTYQFNANDVTNIQIAGGLGNNTIRITGTGQADNGSVIDHYGTLSSSSYIAQSYSFQDTTLVGGGGNDNAQLYGSNNADRLQSFAARTSLSTPNREMAAEGFDRVDSFGRGGNDVAHLYGVQQADEFYASDRHAVMIGGGVTNLARGFERVDAFGRGGNDVATLVDSGGNDDFVSAPRIAYVDTGRRLSYTKDFEFVTARSIGGFDEATFIGDATLAETFVSEPGETSMFSSRYSNTVIGFDRHEAYGNGDGNGDVAVLNGWTAGDVISDNGNTTTVTGARRDELVSRFSTVTIPGRPTNSLAEFDVFLDQLAEYLPVSTVAGIARRLDTNRNVISGTGNAEELVGTNGANEINAGAANDVVFGLGGQDLVRGGGGNDAIDAMDDADVVFGGLGNDELRGGNGGDVLLGGSGNDIVDGEGGTDYVSGGAGNDLYRLISLDGTVIVSDYSVVEDRIELINIDPLDIVLGSQFGSLTISHPEGMNLVLLGVSPALAIDDLNLSFVTSATQTLFNPNS